MQTGLVSVLTPCYNTGKYIHRLLDSILSQSYPQIEMFVIDDGSSDGSGEIVRAYVPQFEERGYKLSLIRQENSGQSVAIQRGLKLVSGEFLVWPDSDDFYASSLSIEKMVAALQRAGNEFAMVRTQENMLEDETLRVTHVMGLDAKEIEEDKPLFEDCLFGKNGFFYCPGAYMVRFDKLKEATDLEIFTAKDAGQNWQLMLPMLYSYRCLTILEPLYNVVQRAASHSRNQYAGYERTLVKFAVYEKTITETLKRIKRMSTATRNRYISDIQIKYEKERLSLAFIYNKKKDFWTLYKQLRKQGESRIIDFVKLAILFVPGGVSFYRLYRQ